MNFIKDNGGPLVIGAIFFAAVAGYVQLVVPGVVDAKLERAGIVAPAKIEAMTDDIEDNKEDIDDFATRWNNLIDALAASRVER